MTLRFDNIHEHTYCNMLVRLCAPARSDSYSESIKNTVSKVSTVEFVAEFIKVALKIHAFYLVVYAQQGSLCVAYCNMHPSECVVGGIPV